MPARRPWGPPVKAALLSGLSLTLSCQGVDAPAPASRVTAPAPVEGFADLHNHVFGEYAYQGAWYHGSTLGAEGGDAEGEGMAACDGNRPGGPQDHAMTIDGLLCAVGGFAIEDVCVHTDRRYGFSENPDQAYSGWPHARSLAHQQNWWGHVHDAWEDGLRLMVVPGVNFRILCQLMEPTNYRFDYDCEDLGAVDLELEAARDFVARFSDWVEIAESPAEARRIIAQGKLALILAIEVTDIFPTGAMDDAPMQVDEGGAIIDRGGVFTQLQRYYDLGVRSIQLAHEFDSRFAGVAVYSPIFELLFKVEEWLAAHPGEREDIRLPGSRRTRYGFDLDENGYNKLGLTDEGRQLVQAMIDLRMPIDIAHLSYQSVDDVFEIARANEYHPLFHSHAKPKQSAGPPRGEDLEKLTTEHVFDLIRATGGMVGLRTHSEAANTYPDSGVANDCDGSTRSFAQTYTYAAAELNLPLGFAVDMNGFATQMGGRFGEEACPGAEADVRPAQQAAQTDDGTGTLYDTIGLGHVGLMGRGLRQDLRDLGVDTARLDASAEAFVRMWERAEDPDRRGPAGPPSVSDRSELYKGLTDDASGLLLAAIVPGDLASDRTYTFTVTGTGAARVAHLLSNGAVIADAPFSSTETVTASQWRTLAFGAYVTVKLGAVSEAPVALDALPGAFFDGAQRLVLAWP